MNQALQLNKDALKSTSQTPTKSRGLTNKQSLLKTAIANDMKMLKKKQIKSIGNVNNKTPKNKEKVNKKMFSKSAISTPKHCRSSNKTVLKQNYITKNSFVYKKSKKAETKCVKNKSKNVTTLHLTPNKLEKQDRVKTSVVDYTPPKIEVVTQKPNLTYKFRDDKPEQLLAINELTNEETSIVQSPKSKPSVTQEVSIIMDLCDKQPSVENSPVRRSDLIQPTAGKQNIRQTIDELNSFVMNILASNKDSQLTYKDTDHSKTDDNILEVEYYDTYKTGSNVSNKSNFNNNDNIHQVPSFSNNDKQSLKSNEVANKKEAPFSSAFLELLNSNVIEEANEKVNMFNLDMMSCEDSVQSEEVSWNIITDQNPNPIMSKLNYRK